MDEWVGRLIENRKCLKKGGRRRGMNSGYPYGWIQRPASTFPTGFQALAFTEPFWHDSPSFLSSFSLHNQVSPQGALTACSGSPPSSLLELALSALPKGREAEASILARGQQRPPRASSSVWAVRQKHSPFFSRVEHRLEDMSPQGERQKRGFYSLP